MPNAGISINEWLFLQKKNITKPLTISRLKLFNKIISQLILHAIVPMNKQGVIHNDMKEDNILIQSTSPTIIDWGISGISTHEHPIPEVIMNRYISISNPFSSILFTTEFSQNYSEFLKQNAINTADHVENMRHNSDIIKKLRDFSLEQYLKKIEYGHYSHIRTFFKNVFNYFHNSNTFSEIRVNVESSDELYHTLASKYISDILIHFTEFDKRDGVIRFQYASYFTKVYIFNCDIWGTIFCYSIFFSFQNTHQDKGKYSYNKYIDIPLSIYSSFLDSILSMYMKQVMINGHEKINTYKLTNSITHFI